MIGKGRTKGKASKPPVLSVIPGSVSDIPEQPRVIALVRGQGKNEYGLTIKQETFAQRVAEGDTLSGAYRKAYDCSNMTDASIYTDASKAMTNPAIVQRVNVLVREKQAKTQHDGPRIRQHVIERLHIEATNPDNPASVRVRALELLGKLDVVQAFNGRTDTDDQASSTVKDLAATLEARLKALTSKAG